MKICIVRPHEADPPPAGVRIRYHRLRDALSTMGHSLTVTAIESIRGADDLDCDVILISKCYDARAILVSASARQRGILCGVDLFDDYFSQQLDSRFTRRQAWLQELAPFLDFVLCSTPRLAKVASQRLPGIPIHLLNDPFEAFEPYVIGANVNRKLREVHATGTIGVAWFGTGVNSHFPVGLHDLVAWASELRRLNLSRYRVRLEILTNRKALDLHNLALLSRMGIDHQVNEWSEEEEDALLARSLAVFLPVNGQSFSTAKSLNRAVSALSSGAQVISAGYPLYQELDSFIYRNTAELLRGIATGHLRLRSETATSCENLLETLASPDREAERLIAFLKEQSTSYTYAPARTIVVLGWHCSNPIEEFADRLEALTIASPFTPADINTDGRISIVPSSGEVSFLFGAKLRAALHPSWAAQTQSNPSTGDGFEYLIPAEPVQQALSPLHIDAASLIGIAERLSIYSPVMISVARFLKMLFPDQRLTLAESENPLAIIPHVTLQAAAA